MQRLTYVVFINLAHYYGKRLCQPRFACALVSFPDHDRLIWPGNNTTCEHAYKIRKWRPSKTVSSCSVVSCPDPTSEERVW